MRNDNRELSRQADALAHDVLHRRLVRVGIIGIQRKRCSCKLVHNIPAGRAHDHIFGKVVRQGALQPDRVLEFLQLAAVGQGAAHQEVPYFLKTKAVFLLEPMDQIVYIITAVGQAAFNRLALALVEYVTMYITQMARPNQYACAIRIAQTALDAEAGEQFRRDTVVLPKLSLSSRKSSSLT